MGTNQRQKLSIIHTESSCGWGGQEIRILTESQGMIERGHQVHIVCPEESNIYREAQQRSIPVTALPIARKKIPAVMSLRKWFKANPADIINTHSSTDSWLSALATRFYPNAPRIVRTRHVSAPVSNNRSTRWLYTSASDAIVTTGEKLKQTLITENRYPESMITSVPTGISTQRFNPAGFDEADMAEHRRKLGIPSDHFIIGIVATIRSWKGHLYLAEALSELVHAEKQTSAADRTTPIHCVIVGDGPSRHLLEDAIQKYQLNDRVTLTGNQDNVVPWLQAMDLFVLPSYANEGVPQSILQAMLCKLPVISTPVGSIEEAVLDQQTGLIIPAKDATSLAHAIQALHGDDDKRNAFAKAGLDHARQHFTSDIMLDSMENIFYQQLGHA